VDYDGQKLTPERLAFQSACYLATREIIAELGLDFVAVKCMPDMTNHYIPQCLSASLLPGPYDADGEKPSIPMACEADGDGALTMEILKLVSGGKPTLFGDLSFIDEEANTIYMPNCGALCSWFAGRSDQPDVNLNQVELRPSFRPSGGSTVYFRAAPGPVTLARLYRKAGQYVMAIIYGEMVDPPPEQYQAFTRARGSHQLPTACIKVNLDFDSLVEEFGSNHISGVAGNYIQELIHVCDYYDIQSIVYDGIRQTK
jgi:L-fucose isomerase